MSFAELNCLLNHQFMLAQGPAWLVSGTVQWHEGHAVPERPDDASSGSQIRCMKEKP